MERITSPCTLIIPGIGEVNVSARRGAKSMRLRWKGPKLALTVPYGLEMDRAASFLNDSMTFIKANRPAPLYSIGQTIQAPGISIEIKEEGGTPGRIRAVFQQSSGRAQVLVAPDVDISAAQSIECIDKIIRRLAGLFAESILLPLARAIADDLGVRPKRWEISRGQRVLGLCSSTGAIKLSSLLALYAPEQRRYVICHELAHLTHMDHSPAFHSLCERYFGGPTAAVRREIKAKRLPLIR